MKKNIVIYVIILLVTVLNSSCILVPEEEHDDKTKTGKNIYDAWNEGMQHVFIQYAEVVFNFDYWYTAPESLKLSIEDSLFADFKIRQIDSENWNLLSGNEVIYTIRTHGSSISVVHAVWEITCYPVQMEEGYCHSQYSSFNESPANLTVKCLAPNQWNFMMKDEQNPASLINLTIASLSTTLPVTLNGADFSVTGTGRFRYNNFEYYDNTSRYVFIDFTIEQFLISQCAGFWKSGEVILRAFNTQNKENFVNASFFYPGANNYQLNIHYNGITESYNYSCGGSH